MVSVCHKTLSESTEYYTIIIFFPLTNMKFRGLVVRTPAFHSEVWGSIPPSGTFTFFKGFTSFSKIIVIKGNFLYYLLQNIIVTKGNILYYLTQ